MSPLEALTIFVLAAWVIILLLAKFRDRRRLTMALTLSGPMTGKITVKAVTDTGAPAPLPGPVSWNSSDPTVATLSGIEGVPDTVAVQFLKPGSVTISAESGGLQASLDFVIEEPVPVATKLVLEFAPDIS